MSRLSFMYHISKIRQGGKPLTRAGEVFELMDTNTVRIILLSVTAVLALLYLWLVNSSATAGFRLSDLDERVVLLEEEFQDLEFEQTALLSLKNVQEQGDAMNLVASETVDVVRGDNAVAFVVNE